MEKADFVEALKVLSDETRIRILKILEKRPAYLCQITAILGFSPSTVSTHLSKLKQFGFVKDRKEGVKVLFSLSRPKNRELFTVQKVVLEAAEDWDVVKADFEKMKKLNFKDICPYD